MLKYYISIFILLLVFLIPEEGFSQEDGEVIRLGPQTIRARVRRASVFITTDRLRPEFGVKNNYIESFDKQIKERPKLDFYIQKYSEFPVQIQSERVINRRRN